MLQFQDCGQVSHLSRQRSLCRVGAAVVGWYFSSRAFDMCAGLIMLAGAVLPQVAWRQDFGEFGRCS